MGLKSGAPLPVALDFGFARPRPSALGWGVLAAGVLALGFAVADYRAMEADLAERTQILEGLRAGERQARETRPSAARASVSAEEVRTAREVASRLNADWGALFSALAAAQNRDTVWLRLDAEPGRGELRLAGEAPSMAEMFGFLARLEHTEGVSEARLSSYEWGRSGPREVVQFNVGAQWGAK